MYKTSNITRLACNEMNLIFYYFFFFSDFQDLELIFQASKTLIEKDIQLKMMVNKSSRNFFFCRVLWAASGGTSKKCSNFLLDPGSLHYLRPHSAVAAVTTNDSICQRIIRKNPVIYVGIYSILAAIEVVGTFARS